MIVTLIVGFLSGIAAAMGLGGGFVLLIYLTAVSNINQLNAQGINLLFFLPIAILSVILHQKNNLIDKRPLPFTIGFGTVGVIIGALVAFYFPVSWLSKVFAVLVLIVGLKEIFHKKRKN